MSSTISKTSEYDDKVHAFSDTLEEFLRSLVTRFPENNGIKEAIMLNSMFIDPGSMETKCDSWAIFSLPIINDIMSENTEMVVKAITKESQRNAVIKKLNIAFVLSDETIDTETKMGVWRYLHILTTIAHMNTGVEVPPRKRPVQISESKASLTSTTNSTNSSSTTVPQTPPILQGGPDFGKIAEGFADSLPKVIDAFSKVLEKDGGNNPIANMVKQFMNPNQLQPGFMNNVAANMLESDLDPVMEQVRQQIGSNISAVDVLHKLQKLERLEKSHQKRKQQRG